MATNLAIDPDLLERALEVSGEKTKTAEVPAGATALEGVALALTGRLTGV